MTPFFIPSLLCLVSALVALYFSRRLLRKVEAILARVQKLLQPPPRVPAVEDERARELLLKVFSEAGPEGVGIKIARRTSDE